MITPSWILLAIAALVALAWVGLIVRLRQRRPHFRPLRPDGTPPPADAPAIDAIVPARNEEEHIAGTVAALVRQDYPRLSITVVDDRSTDRTGAILAAMAADPATGGRLRVVSGVERPPGWVGKTWAVQQGIDRAAADWLWFVDADMGLHPAALATAWREAEQAGADLVSLIPRFTCETFWQAATAMALSEILLQLYPIDRVNDPARPEALASGGFILVRRSAYERAGGHRAVRGEIVEDIALGRRIKRAGGRLVLRAASELVRTHMYGSLGDIWRGLRKNAYGLMEYKFHKYLTRVILALMLSLAPIFAVLLGVAGLFAGAVPAGLSRALGLVGLLGIAAQVRAALPLADFLGVRRWLAPGMPAGFVLYIAIATASVWHHYRGRIIWKDVTFSPADTVGPARPGGGRADGSPAAGRDRDPESAPARGPAA